MRKLPIHAVVGLVIMLVSEAGMLARIEPFSSWHTPICWTGYILFADGLVLLLRGWSWISAAPAEFAFLAVVSVPLWLVFEFFNLFIRNWHYINLPENLAWRTLGYAWSFATIWPGIFETADLVGALRAGRSALPPRATPVRPRPDPAVTGVSGVGALDGGRGRDARVAAGLARRTGRRCGWGSSSFSIHERTTGSRSRPVTGGRVEPIGHQPHARGARVRPVVGVLELLGPHEVDPQRADPERFKVFEMPVQATWGFRVRAGVLHDVRSSAGRCGGGRRGRLRCNRGHESALIGQV
jgi:hypothetical protein